MRSEFSRLLGSAAVAGLLTLTPLQAQSLAPSGNPSVPQQSGNVVSSSASPSVAANQSYMPPISSMAPAEVPVAGAAAQPPFTSPGPQGDCTGPSSGNFAPAPLPAVVHQPIGVWFNADYLLWWVKDNHVPPLVTEAVTARPGGVEPGVIGPVGGTLFAGGNVSEEALSGARVTSGLWLTDSHVIGLEGAYFFLGRKIEDFAYGKDPTLLPTPPVVFPNPAPPGTFQSTISSTVQSAEGNGVVDLSGAQDLRAELLAGFRYVRLHEMLDVDQEFVYPSGMAISTWNDSFRTRNNFYGGQIGVRGEYVLDHFFVDGAAKVALGVTDQRIDMGGGLTQTTVTSNFIQQANVVSSGGGGLLETPASYHRDRFAVIPEVDLNFGYEFTPWVRGWVGYSFLYWSSVARPGDQVVTAPKATDFWTQGLNFGLSFQF
jgi:Putative beta barrel porin-7 (BBP7)